MGLTQPVTSFKNMSRLTTPANPPESHPTDSFVLASV